jgi:hypothetical protein
VTSEISASPQRIVDRKRSIAAPDYKDIPKMEGALARLSNAISPAAPAGGAGGVGARGRWWQRLRAAGAAGCRAAARAAARAAHGQRRAALAHRHPIKSERIKWFVLDPVSLTGATNQLSGGPAACSREQSWT